MWLQNTVRVAELLCIIFTEDILIPRNPGDGWHICMQVLPGLVVRRPRFEATSSLELAWEGLAPPQAALSLKER